MNPAATDWNALALPALFEALCRRDAEAAVDRALAEDLGPGGDVLGDITSRAFVPSDRRGRAAITSREHGVLAGVPVAAIVARRADIGFSVHLHDGSPLAPGTRIATVEGPLASLLAFERTMLNFLTLLSGGATLAARFVEAAQGTRAAVCDTRKTIPGLRTLQKYATRCGGATLHRIGLFDAVLVKDNHLLGVGAGELGPRMREAAARARAAGPLAFVECEVDSLAQLDELLALERGTVDLVLLDNMDAGMLAEAVRRRDARAPWVGLEASGGVRLDTVRRIAAAGVDRISVGAITHSAPALDLGLDLVPEQASTGGGL
jgi:nicotinate-nucleotide pyrophosphorylase (carboxylating)